MQEPPAQEEKLTKCLDSPNLSKVATSSKGKQCNSVDIDNNDESLDEDKRTTYSIVSKGDWCIGFAANMLCIR